MLDYSETPPPLHYSPSTSDQEPSSTRDSTPVGTPVGFGPPGNRGREKEKDLYFSWHRKPTDGAASHTSLYLDSALLEPDYDDPLFPLFSSSPPDHAMAGRTSPIDIATRQTSASPRGQQASNLTSALQGANGGDRSTVAMNINGSSSNGFRGSSGRQDSIGNGMSQWGNGTKPISVNGPERDKPRRESIAGSLVGGMSWGGVSVGSWIRDDIIMAGTSPFTVQSPSYHSSSYLPKLEANFMRDFSCCGITLPSLHDLLQHYEEAHAQKSSQQPTQRPNQAGQVSMPDSRAALAAGAAAAVQQQAQQQQQTPQNPPTAQPQNLQTSQPSVLTGAAGLNQSSQQQPHTQGGFESTQAQPLHDMDTVEDMEMDDAMGETETTPPPTIYQQSQMRQSPQAQYASQNQPRVTPLNMNLMQGHQGLRNSQPTTPVAPGRPGLPLQNNPTVSSVNTPTLMAHPLQQQQQQYRNTPDSSAPGTPGELDESVVGAVGDMSVQGNQMMMQNLQNFGYTGYGMGNDMLDLCIDEPAKRLFSPTGVFNNSQQYAHFRLGGGQYGANSDVARRIREQQMLAGVPDTTAGMMPNDEPKPFRCPVIGCEKAYKNQNGLKYHKSHGHNNQQLHDNADGTFSIVNPETSVPYPGTLGMEKEKPYRCDVCGKRYKNLNGLKYHKSHSPPCNPELQLGAGGNPAGGMMQSQNINIAGAGLPGIGEEGLV